MARQEYMTPGNYVVPAPKKVRARDTWTQQGWFRLLALVFLAELFVPFLVGPLGLPRVLLGVTEVAAALVILVAFAYMLKEDKIPRAVLLIFGITLIWGLVSTFEGQSFAATAWGWWSLFKYPLLGLFAYLVQGWPSDFARWFFRFCVGLLIFEVLMQLVLLGMGVPLGDDSLAGTFGQKGVIQFTMMVFFIVSLALGHWLATYQWKALLLVLVLGMAGSTMNGTKFYLVGVGMLVVVTLILHMIRGGQFRQLFLYVVLIGMAGAIALPVYNSYLQSRGKATLQEMLTLESIEGYLFTDGTNATDSTYNIGRGLAMTLAWQQIQRDWTTTLFGYGLGTRTQSTFLGIRGRVLEDDVYGVGTDTLATWLQEFGLLGVGLFLVFNAWAILKLLRYARAADDPYRATLAYGLILFTLFWPVWMFYQKAWTAGFMMTLYWVSFGYIFHVIYTPQRSANRREAGRLRRESSI